MPDDVLTIRDDIRTGRRTAREVVADHLERIDVSNGHLRAFSAVFHDDALAAADLIDRSAAERQRPLAGVPVAVKASMDVASHVTTHGTRANATPAERDCETVRRLRAAGAVVIGATNMPELALLPITEPEAFGRTVNPAAPSRTVGGSSGGAAAAVAADLVPVAIGEDGCGSVRIPASCSGTWGLKPQYGRDHHDERKVTWGSLLTTGPITRRLVDCAVIGGALYGLDGSKAWHPGPATARIAWTTTCPDASVQPDPLVVSIVADYAERLVELGCTVHERDVTWPAEYAECAFTQYFWGAYRSALAVEDDDLLEPGTKAIAELGAGITDAMMRDAAATAADCRTGVDRILDGYDLLLTPTLATVPLPADAFTGLTPSARRELTIPMVAYTQMFNVTGHPAMSVPAGFSGDGVPIGVQLIAKPGREDMIFATAAQAST